MADNHDDAGRLLMDVTRGCDLYLGYTNRLIGHMVHDTETDTYLMTGLDVSVRRIDSVSGDHPALVAHEFAMKCLADPAVVQALGLNP